MRQAQTRLVKGCEFTAESNVFDMYANFTPIFFVQPRAAMNGSKGVTITWAPYPYGGAESLRAAE